MEAKDTIIDGEELLARSLDIQIIAQGSRADISEALRDHLSRQAEISFKAGIKEVVEWIDKNKRQIAVYADGEGPIMGILWMDIEKKLKEWGIDGQESKK